MRGRAALVMAAVVFLLSWRLAGCGGEDLLVGSATGNPTVTPSGPTPTPVGCQLGGQTCDLIVGPVCCTGFSCVRNVCQCQAQGQTCDINFGPFCCTGLSCVSNRCQ